MEWETIPFTASINLIGWYLASRYVSSPEPAQPLHAVAGLSSKRVQDRDLQNQTPEIRFGRLLLGTPTSPDNPTGSCSPLSCSLSTYVCTQQAKPVDCSLTVPPVASPHRPPLTAKVRRFGRAQLTLVEHALCPLDSSVSLKPNFIHQTTYLFTDGHRNRRKARVKVGSAEGMSAHDELYLWGLLALALSQPEPRPELMATPYYCLEQLGMISTAKRGGREFDLFRSAIKRLAGMRYQNDAFYDPIRGEHRAVSFGLLSYSLPLVAGSSRAWRFAWDPIFFELAQATGGALSFDLSLYRRLDAATRRLYLYLKKIFWRQEATGRLELRHLACDVLGFAPTLETTRLKQKLGRCIRQVLDLDLLRLPPDVRAVRNLFVKQRKGVYTLQLHRGQAFITSGQSPLLSQIESPLVEPLRSIGFDKPTIARLIRTYPTSLIEQWADITLAAIERHGETFFHRSPQAYFVDNVKAAAEHRRTPPDWWRELRKRERQIEREQEQSKAAVLPAEAADDRFDEYLRTEAREAFTRVTEKLLADFQTAGQSDRDARQKAEAFARTHLWNRFRREHPEAAGSAALPHPAC